MAAPQRRAAWARLPSLHLQGIRAIRRGRSGRRFARRNASGTVTGQTVSYDVDVNEGGGGSHLAHRTRPRQPPGLRRPSHDDHGATCGCRRPERSRSPRILSLHCRGTARKSGRPGNQRARQRSQPSLQITGRRFGTSPARTRSRYWIGLALPRLTGEGRVASGPSQLRGEGCPPSFASCLTRRPCAPVRRLAHNKQPRRVRPPPGPNAREWRGSHVVLSNENPAETSGHPSTPGSWPQKAPVGRTNASRGLPIRCRHRDRPPFPGLRPRAQNIRSCTTYATPRSACRADKRLTASPAGSRPSPYETPDMSEAQYGRL
jgi:hypothetical protein